WKAAETHAENMTKVQEAAQDELAKARETARIELSEALTKLHEANLRTQAEHEQETWPQGVIDEAHRRIALLEGEGATRVMQIGALESQLRHQGAASAAQIHALEARVHGYETS